MKEKSRPGEVGRVRFKGCPMRGCRPSSGLTPSDEGLVRFEEPKKFGEGS